MQSVEGLSCDAFVHMDATQRSSRGCCDDVNEVHGCSFPREKNLTVIFCCWWSLPSLPATSEHNVAACPRSRSFWLKLRVDLLHSEDNHLTASIYEPFIHKAVDMIKDNIILIVRAEFGVQALVAVNRHEWVIHAWLCGGGREWKRGV